jgi:hypothetical protein
MLAADPPDPQLDPWQLCSLRIDGQEHHEHVHQVGQKEVQRVEALAGAHDALARGSAAVALNALCTQVSAIAVAAQELVVQCVVKVCTVGIHAIWRDRRHQGVGCWQLGGVKCLHYDIRAVFGVTPFAGIGNRALNDLRAAGGGVPVAINGDEEVPPREVE